MSASFEDVARTWASRRFDLPIEQIKRVRFEPENGQVYSEHTEGSPYVEVRVETVDVPGIFTGEFFAWNLPELLGELIAIAQEQTTTESTRVHEYAPEWEGEGFRAGARRRSSHD